MESNDEKVGAGTPDAHGNAAVLLQMAHTADLFHSTDGRAYASFTRDGHVETHRVDHPAFAQWLLSQFRKKKGNLPAPTAVEQAIAMLAVEARVEGECHEVFLRVAPFGDRIYIDLGNRQWNAVEVTPDDWRIVDAPPVRFRRSTGTGTLPTPVKGGNIADLGPFLNLSSEDEFVLIVAWLLSTFRPMGPYPILEITGEQGTAKSTTTKFLLSLVDPSPGKLRPLPSDERDLAVAANARWVLAFDNISYIKQDMSNALCRLSTGGGFGKRKNYTDEEEVTFDAERPVILNGIGDLAQRPDLLERCVVIRPPRITASNRKDEHGLETRFRDASPAIFGALLTALSSALYRLPSTEVEELPRMADFALFSTAIERAVGWRVGKFMDAYRRNQRIATERVVENGEVVRWLLGWEPGREWTGTASALLAQIQCAFYPDSMSVGPRPVLPKGAAQLGKLLREAAPVLRQRGMQIDFDREGEDGQRTIALRRESRQ